MDIPQNRNRLMTNKSYIGDIIYRDPRSLLHNMVKNYIYMYMPPTLIYIKGLYILEWFDVSTWNGTDSRDVYW